MLRRPTHRDNRRWVALGAVYVPWVDESSCVCALRGDVLSETAGAVTSWTDQSGTGNHHTAPDGAGTEPTYSATGGPNSMPIVTGDGVDDTLFASGFNLAAPGTTSCLIWMVMKQVTWVLSERISSSGASASQYMWYQNVATPGLKAFNGTASTQNDGCPVGQWKRVAVYFSNSTSDFIIAGATTKTGTALGNTASTGRTLFAARSGGTAPGNWANISVAEILYFTGYNAANAAALLGRLDTYGSDRYGATILT